ncbi:alpha/beta hydrolase [Alloscardovia criceti]|uniref:alpha/beta hydrolase n=1 Tax=Alloscardovia criceti TaxID=356828 RepID=UPI00037FB5BA|nr:alpha/beta hydrolase [Alloscardovia criceti]
MKINAHTIRGIDGSPATLYSYIMDNSPEVDEERQRPAVLIIPGGGYEMTSDREAEPIAMQLLAAGFQAFVLRYSVKPSVYPTALIEAAEAMHVIRSRAEEFHVDSEKIAVLGFSAGGHLAANLATRVGDEDIAAHGYDADAVRPNALMLAYPVISSGQYAHRGSFDALLGADRDNAHMLEKLSIEKHVDSSTPPCFLWHTMTDDTVPVENALEFIQACHSAQVSIEAHLYPSGGHGLSLGTIETAWGGHLESTNKAIRSWMPLALLWLKNLWDVDFSQAL